MSRRDLLADDGFWPAESQGLSDDALTLELWRLVRAMADRGMYLSDTDHLSDRELYDLLLDRVLDEETKAMPVGSGWGCYISAADYGTVEEEDGLGIYLRYYANDTVRRSWAEDYPEDVLPPHDATPYDRDRWLPQPGSTT
jgi:hypothetical protein